MKSANCRLQYLQLNNWYYTECGHHHHCNTIAIKEFFSTWILMFICHFSAKGSSYCIYLSDSLKTFFIGSSQHVSHMWLFFWFHVALASIEHNRDNYFPVWDSAIVQTIYNIQLFAWFRVALTRHEHNWIDCGSLPDVMWLFNSNMQKNSILFSMKEKNILIPLLRHLVALCYVRVENATHRFWLFLPPLF